MTKKTKSEAGYGKPTGKDHCGICSSYISGGPAGWGSCKKVMGSIDPKMMCDLFVARNHK